MYGILSHPSERKFLHLKDKYSPCLLVYLKNRHLTLIKLSKKRLSVDRFDGKVEISNNWENSKKFPHFNAPERILCFNFFFQIYHSCGSTFLLVFRVFLFYSSTEFNHYLYFAFSCIIKTSFFSSEMVIAMVFID